MPKRYNVNTAARRNMSVSNFDQITETTPYKPLLIKKKQQSGRNNQGRITVRHRGGGAKRKIRVVDYNQVGTTQFKVLEIHYDPNRSANLALIEDQDTKKKYYIVAGSELIKDAIYHNGDKAPIKAGNRMPLSRIPEGSQVHSLEIQLGKGAQLVRSAGAKAQLLSKEGDYAHIKLPSGEVRLVLLRCQATIGVVGNADHGNIRIGSAGRKRKMGIRPTVRGKAMNPVDHPHGGGEQANSIGLKYPKTPWGKHALGKKTRSNKSSNRLIFKDRRAK